MARKENLNSIKIKEWYEDKSGKLWQELGITMPTPTSNSWSIDISNNELTYKMKQNAACCNMQTYQAAFESWLLFFIKLGINNVWFQWEPIDRTELKNMLESKSPDKNKDDRSKALHYNRFLYRVLKFNEIFGQEGGWFHIEESCLKALNDSEFIQDYINGKIFYVNQPSPARTIDDDSNSSTDRDMANSEAEYEKIFLKKFKSIYENVDRQLPVGLFREEVYNDDNRVFFGGKGAIDLWSINHDNGILNIFELKCPGVKQIGIFTELFFYSMFMLDVLKKKFVDGKPRKKSSEFLERNLLNWNPREICAHYLVTTMHPALSFCGLGTENDMVNEAMRLKGIPVRFKSMNYQVDVTEISFK